MAVLAGKDYGVVVKRTVERNLLNAALSLYVL